MTNTNSEDAMDNDIQAPVAKASAAWIGVGLAKLGIHQWSDVAALVATLYTLILIGEWGWKRFVRDWCERRGWIAPRS